MTQTSIHESTEPSNGRPHAALHEARKNPASREFLAALERAAELEEQLRLEKRDREEGRLFAGARLVRVCDGLSELIAKLVGKGDSTGLKEEVELALVELWELRWEIGVLPIDVGLEATKLLPAELLPPKECGLNTLFDVFQRVCDEATAGLLGDASDERLRDLLKYMADERREGDDASRATE